MLDSHCHLDRYPEPLAVAAEASRQGVFTVAVTNLPSHYKLGRDHVRGYGRVRLALGLHPLVAQKHAEELPDFARFLASTSFVGEVGLDFSRAGAPTRDVQLRSFREVARLISQHAKFVTLHSRGAESEVLAVLQEFKAPPVVFHWYSGPARLLGDILDGGHYFSVNPSMLASGNGRKIIAAVPPDRLLTETDGPYGMNGKAAARPWDVADVEKYLASAWGRPTSEVRAAIWTNFQTLLSRLGLVS